ncbi:MAG: TIGR03936 family radical SAM-associated protein [Thermoguttaceae bacterium]
MGEAAVRERIQIRFSKLGALRYVGHIDLMRILERLFRRARLPLAMSQGFHPKPRVSFPSALGLGYGGTDEVLEMELESFSSTIPELLAKLGACSLDGLTFVSARTMAPAETKARLDASVYEMVVPESHQSDTAAKVATFLETTSSIVTKTNGKEIDVRPAVESLEFSAETGQMRITIRANKEARSGPEVNLRDCLVPLQLEPFLFRSIFPVRTRVRLERKSEHEA